MLFIVIALALGVLLYLGLQVLRGDAWKTLIMVFVGGVVMVSLVLVGVLTMTGIIPTTGAICLPY
jgi:hypothetical protein